MKATWIAALVIALMPAAAMAQRYDRGDRYDRGARYDRGDSYRGSSRSSSRNFFGVSLGFGSGGYGDYSYGGVSFGNYGYRPAYRPVYQPIYRPVYQPVYRPVYTPVYTPVYAPVEQYPVVVYSNPAPVYCPPPVTVYQYAPPVTTYTTVRYHYGR